MTAQSEFATLSLFEKVRIVLGGLLAATAAVVIVPIAALFLGVAFTWLNAATGWFELGETGAWLGVIFGLYALYADIVIGPAVWWRVCAKRLRLSRTVNNIGTATVVTFFSLLCFWVVNGERAITKNAHLEDVSDDGKYVLAGSVDSSSSTLYKIDTSNGATSELMPTLHGYETEASFSPDGSQVVFAYSNNHEQDSTIMLTDLAGKQLHPVLAEGGNDSWPRFSPDGHAIYFIRTSGTSNQKGFDLFSTSLDGKSVKQLTHQNFGFNGELYLRAAPVVSPDGDHLLFTTNEALKMTALSGTDQRPNNLLFELPDAPQSRQYVSAYFSPDNRAIVFMGATEGSKGYDYDAFRVDVLSRRVQKLTHNRGYASDFRLSVRGNKAVFLRWKLSRFQKLRRGFQLQLMDMQSGTITPISFSGLPS
jgi:Tol biopolymer transport system component